MIYGIVARRAGIPALCFAPTATCEDNVLDIHRRIYCFLFRHVNVVLVSNPRSTDSTFDPCAAEFSMRLFGAEVRAVLEADTPRFGSSAAQGDGR